MSIHDQLDAVLAESVKIITDGQFDTPRPAQRELAHDVLSAMIAKHDPERIDDKKLYVAVEAKTGTGKSLAYLAPAMLMAALRQDRTVVSTESLMLQDQLLDKDAPLVAQAVKNVTGISPHTALLKGWSNYVCLRDAHVSAYEVLGIDGDTVSLSDDVMIEAMTMLAEFMSTSSTLPTKASLSSLRRTAAARVKARDKAAGEARQRGEDPREAAKLAAETHVWKPTASKNDDTLRIDKRSYPMSEAVAVIAWALRSNSTKRDYSGDLSHDEWDLVSTSTSECSKKKCPFYEYCAPLGARAAVLDADVVVTNHSYSAIQPASGAPVLIGNKNVGTVDHYVMDEVHGIVHNVRSAASVRVGRGAWNTMVDRFADVTISPGLVDQGHSLADLLQADISAHTQGTREVPIGHDDEVISPTTLARLNDWIEKAVADLPPERESAPIKWQRNRNRAASALAKMSAALKIVTGDDVAYARWIEPKYVALCASPVRVGDLMSSRLYVERTEDRHGMPEIDETGTSVWPVEITKLSVTGVSATMPIGYTRQIGMPVPIKRLPTPFADEFSKSAAYIPLPDASELPKLVSNRFGKDKFDTELHHVWCIPKVIELVRANNGSALVLAAKAEHGKDFVDHLRRAGFDFPIYSQWGNLSVPDAIAAWKADHNSVLVGTRSLMTGVDAPGNTNSLVIIDRIPRSMANVLDDARVNALVEDAAMDKWAAMNAVYAADAQERLMQAVGRLVRRHGDTGAVAILDPRLLKKFKFAYPTATANIYMEAIADFKLRTTDLNVITNWMEKRREN